MCIVAYEVIQGVPKSAHFSLVKKDIKAIKKSLVMPLQDLKLFWDPIRICSGHGHA